MNNSGKYLETAQLIYKRLVKPSSNNDMMCLVGGERKRLGHKPRPALLQRLVDIYGEDKENAIKQVMHQEYNTNGNRYKDLTVSHHNLIDRTLSGLVMNSDLHLYGFVLM